MNFKNLKNVTESIKMPEDMKYRITKNCKTKLSSSRKEIIMKNNKNNTFLRKPIAVFVAVAILLSLSVTALATTGVMKGFFQDITDFRGAVTGTSYEQATDEISMDGTVNNNQLIVSATFINPQQPPYCYVEKLGITEYSITDINGKLIKEGSANSAEIVNGQAEISIPLNDINSGSYKLVVTAFVSEKKADQPLNINGNWSCDFTK